MFHNLENYDAHFKMQQLGKFDLKENVVPNELQKLMSFNLGNKLVSIYSQQFVSSSLDSEVKKLGENDFKHLREESDVKYQIWLSEKDFIPMKICPVQKI